MLVEKLLAEPSWIHRCSAEADAGESGGGAGGEAEADAEEAEGEVDDAPEGQEAAEGEAQDDDEDFEHGGQRWRVPKALVPLLHGGTDYTKKTQALADERKAFEAKTKSDGERATLRAALWTEGKDIETFDAQLAEWGKITEAQWDAFERDHPAEAQKARYQHMMLVNKRQAAFQKFDAKARDYRARETTERTTTLAQAETAVKAKIAGWGPDKRASLEKVAAETYGIPMDMFQAIYTHAGAVEMAHDAMLYRQSRKNASAPAAAAAARPVAKPVPQIKPSGARASNEPSDSDDNATWLKKRYAQLDKRRSNGAAAR